MRYLKMSRKTADSLGIDRDGETVILIRNPNTEDCCETFIAVISDEKPRWIHTGWNISIR